MNPRIAIQFLLYFFFTLIFFNTACALWYHGAGVSLWIAVIMGKEVSAMTFKVELARIEFGFMEHVLCLKFPIQL